MHAARDYKDVGRLDEAERNLALVREAYKGADQDDFDKYYSEFRPDAIAYEAEGLPYGDVYPGKDGCIRLNKAMFASWESVKWNVLQLTAGGDLVIAHLEMTFEPRGDKAITHQIAELWRIRDGKVVELRPFYYDTKLIRDVLSKRPTLKLGE